MGRRHFYATEGIDLKVVKAAADRIRRLENWPSPQPVTIHYHGPRWVCTGFVHDDFEVTE